MSGVKFTIDGFAANSIGALAGTPAAARQSWFGDGSRGCWFDPMDMGTMWQDVAGEVPVTASGQKVARMIDKSGNGFIMSQDDESLQPVFTETGIGSILRRFLQFAYGNYMDIAMPFTRGNRSMVMGLNIGAAQTGIRELLYGLGTSAYSAISTSITDGAGSTGKWSWTTDYPTSSIETDYVLLASDLVLAAAYNTTTGAYVMRRSGVEVKAGTATLASGGNATGVRVFNHATDLARGTAGRLYFLAICEGVKDIVAAEEVANLRAGLSRGSSGSDFARVAALPYTRMAVLDSTGQVFYPDDCATSEVTRDSAGNLLSTTLTDGVTSWRQTITRDSAGNLSTSSKWVRL